MADSKRTVRSERTRGPVTTQQVGPGQNGAGLIEITSGGLTIGYIFSVAAQVTAPNGQNWPVPGESISYTEYWYFRKDALRNIRTGNITSFTLASSNLVPANSNPSDPTLQSDPLTVLPTLLPAGQLAQWTCDQDPSFNTASSPTSGGPGFRIFQDGGGAPAALGFKYGGTPANPTLTNLWWATTTSTNPPSFWFGSASGAGKNTTQVDGSFSATSSYPGSSGSYFKKAMTLDPSPVPIGS